MGTPKEQYDTLTVNTLKQWEVNNKQEDLYLDFKLMPKGVDDAARKNLSKSMSGFANSDGGMIVWGVNAKTDRNTGIDAVQDLQPIENVERALSKLNEYTGRATSPMIVGVEHRAILASNGQGFIVTWVPTSDYGPHMGLYADGHYYKRSGASFYRMEHFDIADMFGRRQQPDLQVKLDYLKMTNSDGDVHRYRLDATVKNCGRRMARFFKIQVKMPQEVLGWPNSNSGTGSPFYSSNPGDPLYPDESRHVVDRLAYHMTHDLYAKLSSRWPDVVVEIYQEGHPTKRQVVSFGTLNNF